MRLLTPLGVAGIAVVHADADERDPLLACLVGSAGGRVSSVPGAPPRRVGLRLAGAIVDDALLVDRGDRGLELHVHGAPAVLAALAEHLAFAADPPPPPALRLLREALGEAQLALAVEQLGYDFAKHCRQLVALPAEQRAHELAQTRERTRCAFALATPARLVLMGAQNAGKSSLFNRLLFRERVATGPVAGLTRDPVFETTVLDGYPYELVDTAGEGDAGSAVDAAAVARGRDLRRAALRLLVVDAAIGPTTVDCALAATADLVVANKTDLGAVPWPDAVPCDLRISCTSTDAVLLRQRVGAALRARRELPPAGPVGGPAALALADLALLR
ncbi:MAG: 50S ribosome-binding GTPase [Planctomycetes bacterium]|nr:50S ribosome-binding GTPase [Planctomycetota bacterium]